MAIRRKVAGILFSASGAGVVVMGLWVPVALSRSPRDKETPMPHIEGLISPSDPVRNHAVGAIRRERKAVVEGLIQLIDPENAKTFAMKTRCEAAFLLGEFRAPEAAPVLVKALPDDPWDPVPDISHYHHPVEEALLKIGRPAAPALFDVVKSTDDPARRRHSLALLAQILGKPDVLTHLDRLGGRATDPRVARRIREAHAWAEANFSHEPAPLD
jgi:HEAT repeat protein